MDTDRRGGDLLGDASPLLTKLLTTVGVGVVVADATAPDLPLVYVNPAFERLTGYPAAEALGRNCRFLQGAKTDPAAVAALRNIIAERRTGSATLVNYRRDGTPFWNEVTLASLPAATGSPSHVIGITCDVTARRRAEVELARTEERFRSLIEHLPMVTYAAERTDRLRLKYVSPQIEALTGYPATAWLGDATLWRQRLHPEDRERVIALQQGRPRSSAALDYEYRLLARDGRTLWLRDRETFTTLSGAGATVIEGVLTDVTAEREAEHRLGTARALHASVFGVLGEGIIVVDRSGRVLDVNAAALRILRRDRAELDVEGWWTRLETRLASGEPLVPPVGPGANVMRSDQGLADVPVSCAWPDGHRRWLTMNYEPLRTGPDGSVVGVVVSFRDTTGAREAQEELERRAEALRRVAERDELTGLRNRRAFAERLDALLGTDATAVVVVDLDHFKFVNDSLGHGTGDGVLQAFAGALRAVERPGCLVARLGSDEFAVLLAGAEADGAVALARELLAGVRSRVVGVSITASVGVAHFEATARLSASDALVAADIALYEAKQAGRDRVAVYGGRPGANLTWLERIRAAIAEDRLTLHAQPVLDLRTGVHAMEELLIRMIDEDGALVPPGSFLPIAEQFGLIRDIDRWVVEQAIARAATGRCVDVNLSARSLADLELPGWIAERIAHHGARPDHLTFEFTETAAVSSVDDAREFTRRLAETGCGAALDDFGTGFGSFVLLKHLPVSFLKIDMEFVRELARSEADQRIVRSIVGLAAGAGMRTVAEGVEDAASLALLREYGVDFAQGFHIARPAPLVDP